MPSNDDRDDQDDEILAGTPYRFLTRLTQGAMGEIIEAEHAPLGRRVIVKLVHRRLASQPGFIDRFRLEAQALAALGPKTPHVVSVLDVGLTAERRPYFVLERLTGRTLKEEIDARGEIPVGEAIALFQELLDALACAHAAGIVHRDVKPENIFLAEITGARGTRRIVKLLDFGIAKVLPGVPGMAAPDPLAQPTEEGTTIGTPRFLSPEQARGVGVDPRSDVYSAGAVLYTMITARDPFAHVTGIAAVLRAHALAEAPAPSAVSSQPIPPVLDSIVLKALAKDRDDRFQSAAGLAAALSVFDSVNAALAPAKTTSGTELMDVSPFRGVAYAARQRRPPEVSPANNAGDAVDSRLPPATNHPAPEAESTAPSNEALPDPGKRPGAVLFAVAAIFVAAAVLALVVIVVMRRP